MDIHEHPVELSVRGFLLLLNSLFTSRAPLGQDRRLGRKCTPLLSASASPDSRAELIVTRCAEMLGTFGGKLLLCTWECDPAVTVPLPSPTYGWRRRRSNRISVNKSLLQIISVKRSSVTGRVGSAGLLLLSTGDEWSDQRGCSAGRYQRAGGGSKGLEAG